jgi:hypothetical protein
MDERQGVMKGKRRGSNHRDTKGTEEAGRKNELFHE